MIKCIAIDDEPLALKQITTYLSKVPFFEVSGSCQSAIEAMQTLSETKADVIFIDINMPDLNGLDFVRSLQDPPIIIFTTAYQEYALDGYKADALDYLLKPFGMTDILRVAGKVKRQYELLHPSVSQSSAATTDNTLDDALFLKTEYKVVRIRISDIIMVEGMSEYLRIHLHAQDKPVIVLLSMKKMEERLAGHRFMRIHKSWIINLDHILELNKSRVVLDNDAYVPIGDSYREKLHDYVARNFLGK